MLATTMTTSARCGAPARATVTGSRRASFRRAAARGRAVVVKSAPMVTTTSSALSTSSSVSTWTREGAREGIAARGDVVVSRAVPVIGDVAELEGGIQAFYLGMLLTILGGAGFIVVRQVLIRRELDDQAKKMGERIRAGNASAEDYFEMGSILLRKKVFTQAVRNLQAAEANWDGDEQDLALVHNALGFGYSNTDKIDDAIVEYKKSVALQPGYVTAWNNLGEAYEKKKELKEAIKCYEESLVLAPNNPTATERLEEIKMRLRRRGQLEE